MATSSQTRSESWGSGNGVCMREGSVSPHQQLSQLHMLDQTCCVFGRVGFLWGQLALIHCSTPKPSFPSPHQSQAHCWRMEGWECVYTSVSVHTHVQGGVSSPPPPHMPHSYLLPTLTPVLTVCLRLLEPTCPCSLTVGSTGLSPHPCHPLLTLDTVSTGPWGWPLVCSCWNS